MKYLGGGLFRDRLLTKRIFASTNGMLMITGQFNHSAKPTYPLRQLQSIARDAIPLLLRPELTPLGKPPRRVGPSGESGPLIEYPLQADQAQPRDWVLLDLLGWELGLEKVSTL